MTIGIVLFLGKNFFGSCNLVELMMAVSATVLVLAMEELIEVANLRHAVEVVLFRWVGGDPLQAAGIPRVKWCFLGSFAMRNINVHEEQQDAKSKHKCADGRNEVPETDVEEPLACTVLRPLIHTSWLTLQTNDMHWSEREVHTDNGEPEVDPTETLVEHLAKHLGPPVVHARKQAEYCATKNHVVEVSNDVIRVSLLSIRRCNRVGDARQTANGELDNDTYCIQHWNSEFD